VSPPAAPGGRVATNDDVEPASVRSNPPDRRSPIGALPMKLRRALGTTWTATALIALATAGSAEAADILLSKIRFPSGFNGTQGTTTPPTAAPLSQTLIFEFSGKLELPESFATALRITVDPQNTLGQPIGLAAIGDFSVDGNRVFFKPRLPSEPLPASFGPSTDISSDMGMPGLLPNTIYRIDPVFGGPNSIGNLKGSKITLPVRFKTTPGIPGPLQVASLYSNAPLKAPKWITASIKPKPGSNGLYPNPFNDPAGLFDSIPKSKRPPFRVKFDGPLDPSADNLGASQIRVRAIKDADGLPVDLVISAESVLNSNDYGGAKISIYPLSILPFGYTVSVEIADTLRALSGAQQNDGTTAPSFKSIAKYRVANASNGGAPVDDFILEDFDGNDKQDATIAATESLQLAGWDAGNKNVLQASFGFGGDGSLGRFEAPNVPDLVVELNTDFQALPLLNGSTPEAIPGTTVTGGVFNFTSFHLPANVVLRARGNNPLVITCTGNFLLEGRIDLNGQVGTGDDTFDSAIAPAPGGQGGAGGGKGGDGHPVKKAANGIFKFIQTPQFAESGFAPGNTGPGGGGGGQCGATMPWSGVGFDGDPTCTNPGNLADGSRGSGGGGGSLGVFFPSAPEATNVKVSGRRGAIGVGNHLPVIFNPSESPVPIPPPPAAYTATGDNDPQNKVAKPNPNPTFAQAYQQGMIYDNPTNGTMNVGASSWAQTKRITSFGSAGPGVFIDSDAENDFIGPSGEIQAIRGGQGGGGGGSRTEGLDQRCKGVIFDTLGLPFTVLDAKGGGGGGGGGALRVQALGTIEIRGANALIEARGGNGAGGEEVTNATRGGAGGGGSGGAVILQSATAVLMNDPALPALVIDVSSGCGDDAGPLSTGATTGILGGEANTLQFADGGPGGPGIVQIHALDTSAVDTSRVGANVFMTVFDTRCGQPAALTKINPLVPFAKTPTPLTPESVARSTWYDLGAVTAEFRPQIATSAGLLDPPLFGVPGEGSFFMGTDPVTGLVMTDSVGNVLNPFGNDFEVDSPSLLKADFVPQGPLHFQSVKIEFQGADEDAANPGLPDVAGATAWVADPTAVNGKRFLRWQVTFNIATDISMPPSPTSPRPQMNFLRIPFKF
jgi:hypothetical protein